MKSEWEKQENKNQIFTEALAWGEHPYKIGAGCTIGISPHGFAAVFQDGKLVAQCRNFEEARQLANYTEDPGE